MAINLVTKAQYKAYAGISSTNQDAQIDVLIPRISEFVKSYCRRRFLDHYGDAKIETFNGGSNTLYLQEYPIVTVLSVDYSSDYGQNYVMLKDYVDFAVDYTNNAVIGIQPTGFPYAINGYRVTYTAGYDTLPQDLTLAVYDLISYYLNNDHSIRSTKSPGSNTTHIEYIQNGNLPAHIKRVLDLYIADYS